MPAPYKKSRAIRFIGFASVFYGAADALLAIIVPLLALAIGQYRPAFEELGRAPMAILSLAGGLGLIRDKPWSRFVYWVLPMYSMIVTLVLLRDILPPLVRSADLWSALNAGSLYWPIATAVLYVFAFMVSNHFWKLDQPSLALPADAPRSAPRR